MIDLMQIALKIIAEMKTSDFDKACDKAGISEYSKKEILRILDARGV